MSSDSELGERARLLAMTLEPIAGQVYFSPECHREYEALGFGPSPTTIGDGVQLPDGAAYFCSRGSVMGQVPGEVVAAAFAVFNPEVVVPAVGSGWAITDAATIESARTRGALAQLTRVLGPEPDGAEQAVAILARAAAPLRPEGRPLFAGLRAQSMPPAPLGAAWRLADQLREFRGDSHINAWTTAGFDGAEMGLLTELFWGLPTRTYIRSRAWTDTQLDDAEARLRDRGLIDEAGFTDRGRAEREAVEAATDRQMRPAIDAIGSDFDELVAILTPWATAVTAAGGYPASGPHELAALASAPRRPRPKEM